MKEFNSSTRQFACILVFLFFSSIAVFAQENISGEEPLNHGFWLERMQDTNVDFYQLQRSFNQYWANRSDHKGNGYKIFRRWEYINESRVEASGRLQSPGFVLKEYLKYMQLAASRSAAGNWQIAAPDAYPVNATSQPTGMGRINAIAFHPTEVNTIYIGSPSGGIWKTTNHGLSWTDLSAGLPSLGVSSIVVNPENPDVIYIGTGDRDANDAPGIGVYKTTDGGQHWTQINGTMGNVTVGALIMHPTDRSILYAATSGGIYKTVNAGATWTGVLNPGNFKDIQFKPGDPTVLYAAYSSSGGAWFYRSGNSGVNWSWISTSNGVPAAGSRMVIGTTPADPDYVYLVLIKASDKTFQALLRSTDSGLNFTTQSTSPNIFDYACNGSGTATQATYDLCITADPLDKNVVYVGSINNWKSTDGGSTWSITTHWSGDCNGSATAVHADQHVYGWSPHFHRLYVGHDGGLTFTANDGGEWTEITGPLPITQLYKIGQSAISQDVILYGQQDNGSNALAGGVLTTVRGGDGTECLVDYTSENYCYNTYVQGDISRSVTGPAGFYSNVGSTGTNGIGSEESGAWVTPYFLDKTNPSVMFAGYQNVFRCDNIKASPSSSVTWTAISSGESETCRVMEQSAANTDILYVYRLNAVNKLQRTDNAGDSPASVSWTICSLPVASPITDLKTHPTDENIVYAAAGTSIYKSVDKGITWSDMDPLVSLPDLFINCLVIDKNSNEGIYIGNQAGVWYKDATMTSWMLFSTGLPPVDIRELEIFYDPTGTQHRLKAATYGRGLWQSDLFESGVLNPTGFEAEVSSNTSIDLTWALSQGNEVLLAYNTSPTFGNPVDGSSYTTTIPGGGTVLYNGDDVSFNHSGLTQNTTYYYKIWSCDGAMNYSSGSTANATTTYSVADFNADNSLSCSGNLTVNFTDASIGAWNSWAWDVDNDGVTDYTTQNPTHTYNQAGLYSVKLTINNGAASTTKHNLILVMADGPEANTTCTFIANSNLGNGYGIGIYRFSLAGIDNTTQENDGDYQNYTCSHWTLLEQGTEYTLTIQTGTANNEGAAVYIDYDNSGTFESVERVATFPSNKVGTRSVNFSTPSTGIETGKGLRLRVLSKYSGVPSMACDVSSYGQAEDYTVYFEHTFAWDGSSGTDWEVAANWVNDLVPVASSEVVIPGGCSNYPVLASGVACKDLTISGGASLVINPGAALTITGDLTNEAGAEGLIIKSDAGGTGSLLHSTTGVQATIERYIGGSSWGSPDDGWHLLSSPVASQSVSDFTVDPATDYDFYAWSEAGDEWVNFKDGSFSVFNNGNNFVPGRGYLIAYKNTVIQRFSGVVNTADVTMNLTRTGSNDYAGFNLIGNPFASAVSWNPDWASGNVGGVAYIWDEAGKDYIPVESGDVIPSMNGMMVYLGSGNMEDIIIPSGSRQHNPQSWYKTSVDRILLVAHDLTSGASKQCIVRFNPEATGGFDLKYDGLYLKGYAPEFYTVSEGRHLTVNTLRSMQDQSEIPLSFVKSSSESYSVELAGSYTGMRVLLKDKKLSQTVDLTQQRHYNFSSADGEAPDRFELSFTTVGIDEDNMNVLGGAWMNDGCLYINSSAVNTAYEVLDLQGQILQAGSALTSGIQAFPVRLPAGIYIVRLTSKSRSISVKVVNF